MRPAPVGAAVLIAVLLAVPLASAAPQAPPAPLPTLHGVAARGSGWVAPPTPAERLAALFAHNQSGPLASGTPTGAYQETPAPPVPATTPTVVHVVTGGLGCCYYVNQTPAGGPWDSVVLNYTGVASGSVYDSSYRAYVGGAEVLYGTTPEYGTWTVLQNITEYESLLRPGANFTFILSAAVNPGGSFATTITISFYPPPGGGPVPSEPSKVLPLWLQYIKPTVPVVTANATLPSDTSAVALELWTYGMGPNGGDEFWWSESPPERAVEVSLDGQPLFASYPFPYVNMGGIDLFLWRPIPGVYTLDDRPYLVNLTGALGAMDGSHEYNATIQGRNATNPWWVAGSLLVWTNGSVSGATLTSGAATFPNPVVSGATDSSSTSFSYQSTLRTGAGTVPVSSVGAGSFRETETTFRGSTNGTSWGNFSQSSSFSDATTVSTGGNGTTYSNDSRSFGLSVDLGSAFVESSTTSGGYPIYGNATTDMLNFDQSWNELLTQTSIALSGVRTATTDAVADEVPGANGIFSVAEKFASASSGTVLGYTLVQSATPKYTSEFVRGPGGTTGYAHVMTGSTYQPTDPNLAETIVENQWTNVPAPLVASVVAEPDPADVGASVVLQAGVHGGAGTFSYAWANLPPGCAAANASSLSCQPSIPGTYAPTVTVSDVAGDEATSAPGVLVVDPVINATVTPTSPGADVGGPLAFTAQISGGTPPYNCSWSIAGAFENASCAGPVTATTAIAGSVTATVTVVDATGASVNASSAPVPVHEALTVRLVSSNSTSPAGAPLELTATVSGGTPPFAFVWSEGTTTLAGAGGSSVTVVPTSTGSLNLSVRATDAAGGSAVSNTVTVAISPATGSPGSNSGGSGNGGVDPLDWVVIGLAAVAVLEAVFLIARRLPPAPPSRRR